MGYMGILQKIYPKPCSIYLRGTIHAPNKVPLYNEEFLLGDGDSNIRWRGLNHQAGRCLRLFEGR